LAFGVVLEDAYLIESTSLVNRPGSVRACLKDVVRLRHADCDEGWVLTAHCSVRQTTWSGAKEGQNGKHPAMLVGRLGQAELLEDLASKTHSLSR